MRTILKKGIAVNCKTEEEAKEFLAMLDKDKYLVERLLKNSYWEIFKEKTCYGDYCGICYGQIKDFTNYKIISFAEFKQSLNTHWKSTITEHLIKGNKTIIKLSNGKVGTANCLPTDKFNEGYGAILAVARAYNVDLKDVVKLLEKKEPIKIEYFTDENGRKYHIVKQDKYEVGDKVKGKNGQYPMRKITSINLSEPIYRVDDGGLYTSDYILGKVIYDEPELHFAKDIIGKWAVCKGMDWVPTKYRIIFVDDKNMLLEYANGTRRNLENGSYSSIAQAAFGKVWEVVEC